MKTTKTNYYWCGCWLDVFLFIFATYYKSTRVNVKTATLIDNIYCKYLERNYHLYQGILFTDISDYFPIFCISKYCSIDKLYDYEVKVMVQIHCIVKFQAKLNANVWDNALNCANCQVAYSLFHAKYTKYYDECFPRKSIKVHYINRKVWITQGFKRVY